MVTDLYLVWDNQRFDHYNKIWSGCISAFNISDTICVSLCVLGQCHAPMAMFSCIFNIKCVGRNGL